MTTTDDRWDLLGEGERRTFVCLQVDLEDHSGIEFPDHQIQEMKSILHAQVQGVAAIRGGRQLSWGGDGGSFLFLVVYGSAIEDAVFTGIQILRSLELVEQEVQRRTGCHFELKLRVSVDMGELLFSTDPGLIQGPFLNRFLKHERDMGRVHTVSLTERVWSQLQDNEKGWFDDSGWLQCVESRVFRLRSRSRPGDPDPLSEQDRFILPLHLAESRHLQALLYEFRLSPCGVSGTNLTVNIGRDTPAIWNDMGKRVVRGRMTSNAEAKRRYQTRLDRWLLRTGQSDEGNPSDDDDGRFQNLEFPFRYCSGGTLPILWLPEKNPCGATDIRPYFCFFYREVHPIGWNIANGGADSRQELLNPQIVIQRELLEELIILSPRNRIRYTFDWAHSGGIDLPEFRHAQRLVAEVLQEHDLQSFSASVPAVVWLEGPDAVEVFLDGEARTGHGYFLNVNAEDFGIELDKVVSILVDDDIVLLDGEVVESGLVGAPIGLFEVRSFSQRFDRWVRERDEDPSACESFLPDRFFYLGRRHDDPEELQEILSQQYLPRLEAVLDEGQVKEFKEAIARAKGDIGAVFGLCPVTTQIVRRALAHRDGAWLEEHRKRLGPSARESSA